MESNLIVSKLTVFHLILSNLANLVYTWIFLYMGIRVTVFMCGWIYELWMGWPGKDSRWVGR